MRTAHRASRYPKIAATGLVLALCIAVAVAAGWRLTHPPPAEHRTARVVRGTIEDMVLASAVLVPWRQVDVGAQASGQLRRVLVEPGQRVRRGELLAEIDPALAANDLKVSTSTLAGQLALRRGKMERWRQAVAEANRQQVLLAQDYASRRDAQAAQAAQAWLRAEVAELDARIAETRARIDSHRTALAYTRISAPMDGEVVSVATQQGQTVNAAQQAPTILKLADLSRMKVRAQVSEADIQRVRPGLKVWFSLLGTPERRHYGTLRHVLPAPEKINNAMFYNAVFHVDNPDGRFRNEMSAQVGIVLAEAGNALIVPTSALEGGPAAYRVRVLGADGRIEMRRVAIGIRAATRSQILNGLAEGERVILSEPAPPSPDMTVSVGAET